jgi:hypothetical protein
MLFTLPGKSALAQTAAATTFNASGPELAQQLFIDKFRTLMLYTGYDNNKGSKALLIREAVAVGVTGLTYRYNRYLLSTKSGGIRR